MFEARTSAWRTSRPKKFVSTNARAHSEEHRPSGRLNAYGIACEKHASHKCAFRHRINLAPHAERVNALEDLGPERLGQLSILEW
jgi:hypothetical protein